MYTFQVLFAHSLVLYGGNCVGKSLYSINYVIHCIVLTMLSMSKKMKANCQNLYTVLCFNFHICNGEECN